MAFDYKSFLKGIRLVPVSTTAVNQKGDLEVLDASGKINYFNGTSASPLVTEAHSATLTNKTISAASNTISLTNFIVNADINSAAAIVYSKLNLVNSIVNADINASAAIAYSKLNLVASIVNADINASAAIAYSKLALTNSIVNADINASAAIARTKIASGSVNHVIINDGSGILSSEATLAKSRGGSAQDNSSLTFPASGTLATLAGTETFSNKTFSDAITDAQIATPSNPSAGFNKLYFKSDNNLYSLTSAGVETVFASPTGSEPRNNFLYNSNFDIWQRQVFFSPGTGNSTTYCADRWYFKATGLNAGSTPTVTRISEALDGSKYQLQMRNESVNSATGTLELYQTLENFDSLQLYNQNACFSVKVKAAGNVNQVGIQFMYKTTEGKVDTAIGSEVLSTISTAGYTTVSISGQALGTAMTSAGVIGVRIRPTAASSGNTLDNNNGIKVAQTIVNIGSTVAEYQRMHKSIADELLSCQRYYEKSYKQSVFPGAVSFLGEYITQQFGAIGNGGPLPTYITFKANKRSLPATTAYSPATGTANRVFVNSSVDVVVSTHTGTTSENSCSFINNNGTNVGTLGELLEMQWTAEAEI